MMSMAATNTTRYQPILRKKYRARFIVGASASR